MAGLDITMFIEFNPPDNEVWVRILSIAILFLLALPLREAREQFERAYLKQQLVLCDGKVAVGLLDTRQRAQCNAKLRILIAAKNSRRFNEIINRLWPSFLFFGHST